jgi:putative phosphonate metabolism protein
MRHGIDRKAAVPIMPPGSLEQVREGALERAGARFAIYFTPRPSNLLARFGHRWLGRDAATGLPLERPALDGFSPERLAAVTAEPARYGWHATLKPPFHLAAGETPGRLVAHLMAFAAARLPFEIPALRLAALDGFLALVPSDTPPLLAGLAEDCVRAFEPFRRPLTDEELTRRRALSLSLRQDALLARWGYPYVMEEFRFHMTLTGWLETEERARLARVLEPVLAPLLRYPVAVDGVTLFVQPAPDEPFRQVRRFPFEGA